MRYTIRKQDTITPSWGIYCNNVLVEGGFSSKRAAEEYMWKEYNED